MAVFKEVDPKRPVNDTEIRILNYWKDNDIASKSVAVREGSPRWIFYEGPPTANGKPGIHHVISRTLKDIACRYKTMQGFQVHRKAGWDTHGLPVEIEVEKQLGLTCKPDIEQYGIEQFNHQCRQSVLAYEKLWREFTERTAYWVDMDHPYITMTNDYIETEWWILKKYFEEGLIYEGHKILPYCPRCGTPLASHEVAQGYKDETIDSIYVRLKVKKSAGDTPGNEYLLIWTTTPWTLPSNVTVTANPESTYVKARLGDDFYYVVKERVEAVLGKDAEIVEEFPGKNLEYMEYEQLFPFVTQDQLEGKAFFVTLADYVMTTEGTGLVHTAPAYGEDDYKTCQKYGIPLVHLVDEQGRFVPAVTDWAGEFVKEADPKIIRKLKEEGKLWKRERMTHSYPHCWRCDTPLLYYARKSWYIATTKYQDRLIAANNRVKWYPEHVGKGRFGDWLENLVDWSLSRNRYWGTPLNIWKCEQCGKLESIGSRKELAEKAVEKIDPETFDLHRPFVDDIHLTCSCGGRMTRTPEVIDCWFDSGSMPFAQWHYPFEHKDDFHKLFPADFICEGLDQTRGWFYSLMAISTFLFDTSPYKSVLVNDLVLDKDGQKMSKSRGNVVDPWDMIDKFGVDALRWYLIAVSPPWVPTRFDEDGVREIALRFFGTLQNVYAFFTLYANIDNLDPREFDIPVKDRPEIDRWVISRVNSLAKTVRENMESYELTKVVRAISSFLVDEVSNWYVRRNRERFWSNDFNLDKKAAYLTLYEVLLAVAKMMAPFAPYIAEDIYLNLTHGKALESVHFELYPDADPALVDKALEDRMGLVIELVSLGRAVRNKVQIKTRQPLSKVLVNGKTREVLQPVEDLVKEELNVKAVEYVDDLGKYVDYEVKPNLPVAGPKYGKRLRSIIAALASGDAAAMASQLERENRIVIEVDAASGQEQGEAAREQISLAPEDILVRISAREGFAVEAAGDTFAILDTEITRDLMLEGMAREIVSKVQTTRKNSGFNVTDHIRMSITGDAEVGEAIRMHRDYITGDTLCDDLRFTEGEVTSAEAWDINGHPVLVRIENLGRVNQG
ncbi:MAG: isoleucine--tRNA ligase [Bacillota bacterium]|jgi:isoleucyl-tRNA synthetase